MTPRECVAALCQILGYSLEEMRSPARHRDIVAARWTLIAVLYEAGYGLSDIGRILDRHHTTILSALRRCGVWVPQNKQWGVQG